VALYLIAYLVPEIFRLVAGPTDAMQLHPLPILINAKEAWNEYARVAFYCIYVFSSFVAASIWFCYVLPTSFFLMTSSKLNLMTLSLTLSSICTVVIMVLWNIFSGSTLLLRFTGKLRKADRLAGLTRRCYRMASSLLTDVFALDAPTRRAGPGIILVLVLSFVIGLPLLQISWDGYIYSLKWPESVGLTVILLICIPQFFFYSLVPLFFITVVSRLIYGLLFVGSLSSPLRRITGVNGTSVEFWSGYFLLLTICTLVMFYAHIEWDPTGTYKPAWAE
jgi:hypothetical protein